MNPRDRGRYVFVVIGHPRRVSDPVRIASCLLEAEWCLDDAHDLHKVAPDALITIWDETPPTNRWEFVPRRNHTLPKRTRTKKDHERPARQRKPRTEPE